MSAFTRMFSPRAGWFGVQLVNTEVGIGTGGISIADTATTSIMIPVPAMLTTYPKAEAQLVALNFSAHVAAISAGGTVLMQAFRRNNQGTPADVTLTAAKSIEADVISVADWTYAFPITATDNQSIFLSTDALRLDIVTTNSVGTQPSMTIAALWAVRRI